MQENFGGGEVYTRFFSEALIALGWEVELYVARGAGFWRELNMAGVRLHEVSSEAEILDALPPERSLVVTHTAASPGFAAVLAQRHRLTGFAHMPLYERNPAGFACYQRLFAVSRHVLDSARARGLSNLHPEPMYGVADLSLRPGAMAGALRLGSVYDWDQRKFRDRLLGTIAPLAGALLPRLLFTRRPGLTLGIVSRLTPIKQFPHLFSLLAPVLAKFPQVNLEIFGSGGYASVRDLKRALAPAKRQVRFWGQQADVAAVYGQLDYVLSGLPEKEALGLNLIEAQSCGTPVLAVNAPPFTETVVDGASGWLFEDPRRDGGQAFEDRLARLVVGAARPDPRKAVAHLARFSRDAFSQRVAAALATPVTSG
ncbi:MAG: glycosyltransferase family 4 protein [Betaproteobacteria bacterium]